MNNLSKRFKIYISLPLLVIIILLAYIAKSPRSPIEGSTLPQDDYSDYVPQVEEGQDTLVYYNGSSEQIDPSVQVLYSARRLPAYLVYFYPWCLDKEILAHNPH